MKVNVKKVAKRVKKWLKGPTTQILNWEDKKQRRQAIELLDAMQEDTDYFRGLAVVWDYDSMCFTIYWEKDKKQLLI